MKKNAKKHVSYWRIRKALETLSTQEEQLDEIIEAHKDITKMIDHAEEQLNVIEHGLLGRIANFFKRCFNRIIHLFTGHHKKKEAPEVEYKNYAQPQEQKAPLDSSTLILDKTMNNELVEGLNLPPEKTIQIDRITQKLELLEEGVANLRQQALAIGHTLDEQNQHKLTQIIEVTDENQIAMKQIDRRTRNNI